MMLRVMVAEMSYDPVDCDVPDHEARCAVRVTGCRSVVGDDPDVSTCGLCCG